MGFVADAPVKRGFVPDAPPPDVASSPGLMDVLKGVGDAALSGAAKVSTGIVGAPVALANRLVAALSGGDPQAAADAAHEYVNSKFGHDTQTPVGKQIGSAVSTALAPVGQSLQADSDLLQRGGEAVGIPRAETHGALSELGDIMGTAGATAPALAGARASTEAAALAAQNVPTAVAKYGMRTAEDHPIARNIAGGAARPAVTAHNQSIADPVLGAQAGVAPGPPLNAAAIEAAQAGPDSVYARARAAIPTGPLSPQAAQMVNSVGAEDLVTHSPDVQAQVAAQKQRLLAGDLTGSQVVDANKSLRFNGFKNISSDDPEQVALGRSQLQMSDALHQHMVDTIPANADVSPAQLADARRALAQNYTVGSLLKGGNVDLQALARIHRNSPGLLTGPLGDIAEFADQHPEVTSLPSKDERFNPSGVAKDVASVDLKNPVSYLQPLFGGAARRVLTGPRVTPQVPITGRAGEFAPLDGGPPQPPAGMSLMDELGAGGHPQASGGGIPLMDLLSHGVEQEPASGLSAGPMGAPAPEGMPFHVPPESVGMGPLRSGRKITEPAPSHIIGVDGEPVETGMEPHAHVADPHEPSLMDLLEDLRDHPAVMHQNRSLGVSGSPATQLGTTGGVPEDLMTHLENNASGESSASMEAINRTRREQAQGQDRFLIDQDGKMWPIRGVESADATAPRGSIIVQKGIGGEPYSILDRGGLPRAHAHGLLNRAMAGGHGMTLADLLEGGGG